MGLVLLIDPDQKLTGQVRRQLERRGHHCRVATSAASARRMVRSQPPDLVVLSSTLPDVDALDFLPELTGGEDRPVVVTFGENEVQLSARALARGAFDAFPKTGATAERLAGRVDAILDGLQSVEGAPPAEQLLAEANAILRAQLDTTSEGVFVADTVGRVVSFNRRFLALWNIPKDVAEAVDARPLLTWIFEGCTSDDADAAHPERLLQDPESIVDQQIVSLRGDKVISWSTHPVRLEDGTVIGRAFGFRDLTPQVAAEEQVRFHTTLLEHIPCAVVATSLDGTVRYWNRFTEVQHGWSAEETIGRDVRKFLFPEETWQFGVQAMQDLRSGSGWSGEIELRRKDGSTFPGLLTLTQLSDGGGSPSMILGVIIDLSERRHLEARLLQAQKMEAVGTLAGGLAHDFNNLLTGVLGSAGLVRELPDTNPMLTELMDMIERAALRGRDLCNQLLSFSRAERPEVAPVNVLETISEVVKIVERTFPKEVRISVRAPGDLPAIMADRSQINQALMNLLVNARDSMPNGGTLVVEARVSDGIPADSLHGATGSGDRYMRLEVTDSGSGMDSSVLKRIFEPFFTTKGSGKGTGLGLPMVFSIARSHGGEVRVWSTVGTGTSVALFVPAAEVGATTPRDRDDGFDLERFAGDETILVVDDEAIVRSVGARILRQFGYRTLEAANGTEALRLLTEPGTDISAVLLDIVMPEMEGPEVFRRLRAQGVRVPVLLCSGFSVDGIVDGLLSDGAAGFVQKPYRLRELLPTLRATLDAAPGPTS